MTLVDVFDDSMETDGWEREAFLYALWKQGRSCTKEE